VWERVLIDPNTEGEEAERKQFSHLVSR
jgi:hypothetical protein